MTEKEFTVKNKKGSINIAHFLTKLTKQAKIITLEGEMGSGKSFLCYHISRILLNNKSLNFSSPSYNIVNIYQQGNFTIYHIDLYRITNLHQLYELGIDEILEIADFILIEWPKLIFNLLKSYNFIEVKLELLDVNLRKYKIKFHF